jgi:hypothetical protein
MTAHILLVGVNGQTTGYALVCSNCAKTCNGRKNTPADNWGRMSNVPGHMRGNGEAAERLNIYLLSASVKANFGGSSQFHILTAYKLDILSVVHRKERTRTLPRDDDRN